MPICTNVIIMWLMVFLHCSAAFLFSLAVIKLSFFFYNLFIQLKITVTEMNDKFIFNKQFLDHMICLWPLLACSSVPRWCPAGHNSSSDLSPAAFLLTDQNSLTHYLCAGICFPFVCFLATHFNFTTAFKHTRKYSRLQGGFFHVDKVGSRFY